MRIKAQWMDKKQCNNDTLRHRIGFSSKHIAVKLLLNAAPDIDSRMFGKQIENFLARPGLSMV